MRSIALLSLVTLTACSSYQSQDLSPVPAERLLSHQQSSEGSVPLKLTRDEGFLGGGCYVAFTIDHQIAARIGAGEYASFQIPQGQHVVGIIGDKDGPGLCAHARLRRELLVTLEAGGNNSYRIISDNRSGFDILPDKP